MTPRVQLQPDSRRTRAQLLLPDSYGLLFATLVALLIAMLGVSLLSTYDEEARWLRFGTLLFAAGLGMWLPFGWAAASAAVITLATAAARGGFTDAGVLRPETMLEVPGIALTAALAAWLRHQIESSFAVREFEEIDAEGEERPQAASPAGAGPALAAAMPLREPPPSAIEYGVGGARLSAGEESRAFVASAKAALKSLDSELARTRRRIGDAKGRLWGGVEQRQGHA